MTKYVKSVEIKYGTHIGKPIVFFSAEDYFVNLEKECRLTLIENFYKEKPSMEDIKEAFIRQYHLKGSVKIAYFDFQHVYIDFSNEIDYTHIQSKKFADIDGTPMKIMLWTPNFKPEVESPIVLVWIRIHQLPWHLFKWGIVSRMVQSVGVSIASDQATYSKFRGNIAKINVESALLKPKLNQIWLGFNMMDGGEDGVWLDIECKGVTSYFL